MTIRRPRRTAAAALGTLLLAGPSASQAGYKITGSMHDFKGQVILHRDGNLMTYGTCGKCHTPHGGRMVPENRCSMCHGSHRVQRVKPLWARAAPNLQGWLVWNGAAGQALDGGQGSSYLSAEEFAGTGSGMCLSCHDSGIAGSPHLMADTHPLAKLVPFGTPGWQTDVAAGNAASGSSVVVEARGSVGCTSCHSLHNGADGDRKLRRPGESCLSCHDR